MHARQRYEDDIERTLAALDHLPLLRSRAVALSRIESAMAASLRSDRRTWRRVLTPRPTLLALLILLNIATAMYFSSADTRRPGEDPLVTALRSDYEAP